MINGTQTPNNSECNSEVSNYTTSLGNKSQTTKNRSKSHNDANLIVDGYQQKQFHFFYNSYIEVLENIKISKPELVKRSFEKYMDLVEENYIDKMNEDVCQKIKNIHDNPINSVVPIEYTYPNSDIVEALGIEFYLFYKILDMHWKMLDVKKKDILLLSPCKIFLLQSIVRRKYQDELDFK